MALAATGISLSASAGAQEAQRPRSRSLSAQRRADAQRELDNGKFEQVLVAGESEEIDVSSKDILFGS